MPISLKITAILLNLLLILHCQANSDTIVKYSDLSFHSELETEAFESIENSDNPDYFKLFIAADPEIDSISYNKYSSVFNKLINEINTDGFREYSNKKKVKKTFRQVHDALLDKYVEIVPFSSIFTTGEYQCVTASMLYALAFNKLDIPYQISILPTHAFLTAYPNSQQVIVETTDPNRGTKSYDNSFKVRYVEFLRNNKLISTKEYHDKSVNQLFEEYFLQTEIATKEQLMGAQYYNLSGRYLSNESIKEAFNNIKKSYYLYPGQKTKFFLMLNLGLMIDITRASDPDYASLLSMYCRSTQKTNTVDNFLFYFMKMTDMQLNYDGNVKQYKKSFETFINGVNDSVLISEVSYIYHFNMGSREIQLSHNDKAYMHYEKAWEIKPDNIGSQQMLVTSFINSASTRIYDPEQMEGLADSIEVLFTKHETLRGNMDLVMMQSKLYLDLMRDAWYNGKVQDAKKYQNKFEETYLKNNNDIFSFMSNEIGRAYASAASYYFKRNNYTMTRKLLNKGLEYSPNNYLLKSRLNSLN